MLRNRLIILSNQSKGVISMIAKTLTTSAAILIMWSHLITWRNLPYSCAKEQLFHDVQVGFYLKLWGLLSSRPKNPWYLPYISLHITVPRKRIPMPSNKQTFTQSYILTPHFKRPDFCRFQKWKKGCGWTISRKRIISEAAPKNQVTPFFKMKKWN